MPILGEWTANLHQLSTQFNTANPYPHVVIPNFFSEQVAERLFSEFPMPTSDCWFVYKNPLEDKLACNDFNKLPSIYKTTFDILANNETVSLMSQITGISDLESDRELFSAGLHQHTKNGKLGIHLDNSHHPSGKERRITLVVYMCKNWKTEYGGDLELWDDEMKHCVSRIVPAFNNAVLFQTSGMCYHGFPDPIDCPQEITRNSLACYYLSPPRLGVVNRPKAQFVARPTDAPSELLDRLREIRKVRRIENDDLI